MSNLRKITVALLALIALAFLFTACSDEQSSTAPTIADKNFTRDYVPFENLPRELYGPTLGGVEFPAAEYGKIHNELLDIFVAYNPTLDHLKGTYGLHKYTEIRGAFADYLKTEYGVPVTATMEMLALLQATKLPPELYNNGEFVPTHEFVNPRYVAAALKKSESIGFIDGPTYDLLVKVVADHDAAVGKLTFRQYYKNLQAVIDGIDPSNAAAIGSVNLLLSSTQYHQVAFGNGEDDVIPLRGSDVAKADFVALIASGGNPAVTVITSAATMLWEMMFEQ